MMTGICWHLPTGDVCLQPRSFGGWNANGTCELPGAAPTYQQCAALGNGATNLTNLTKAAFTYTNATCNYPSEGLPHGSCDAVSGPSPERPAPSVTLVLHCWSAASEASSPVG